MDVNLLKQQLQERANLSPEQAEKAAQVAVEFFSEHVPGAADLIEKGGGGEGIGKRIGSFFNR